MQQYAHLARLSGGGAIPLALLTQRTGAATANAGRIHDAQTPIGFSASLVRYQRLASGATQRAIGLKRKILTGEATCDPAQAHLRGSIARGRSRVRWGRRDGRSNGGGAHRVSLKLMTQFQTQVPHPLSNDLPCPLSRLRCDYTSDRALAPGLRRPKR